MWAPSVAAILRATKKGLNGPYINPKCKNIWKYSFEMVHYAGAGAAKKLAGSSALWEEKEHKEIVL